MKVLITGGHFSPAYSLIKELESRGHKIAVVGRRFVFEGDTSESLEYKICKEENIHFFELKTGRFQRKFTPSTIPSLLRVVGGFKNAKRILEEFKPDVVLTFGGYIAPPVALAAKFQKIPVVLHEQTQQAGLSGKFVARFAKYVCVSFRESKRYFPGKKVVFTGLPLRSDIFDIKKKIDLPKGKLLYITGGSSGSHFINVKIREIIDDLVEKYVVIHQTGENGFSDFENSVAKRETLPETLQKKYVVRKFINPDEIGFVLNDSDLILSRAGANTILEFFALSRVSLLIPLESGQSGEQLANASLVKKIGVGDYMTESQAESIKLLKKINNMFEDLSDYRQNMGNARSYIVPNAASKIADIVGEACGKTIS